MGRVSVWEDEKKKKGRMDSDGGTTIWIYLMPLKYMLKNG